MILNGFVDFNTSLIGTIFDHPPSTFMKSIVSCISSSYFATERVELARTSIIPDRNEVIVFTANGSEAAIRARRQSSCHTTVHATKNVGTNAHLVDMNVYLYIYRLQQIKCIFLFWYLHSQ